MRANRWRARVVLFPGTALAFPLAMRLLLVEDEPAISTALSRSVRRWGHEVHVAGSLAEARKLAAEHAPEGLLSDCKLPDGQGLDFARALGVPFVLMSGYASFDDAVDALRLGCVDFLTKPVSLDALRTSLGRLGNRFGNWELCVIGHDTSGLRLLRPSADGFAEQALDHGEFAWADAAAARDAYARAEPLAPTQRERRILAELFQASPNGALLINRGPAWWRAALRAGVAWEGSEAARDRRDLVQRIADRAVFRPSGVLVECTHDR